jgi:hypothetical protein
VFNVCRDKTAVHVLWQLRQMHISSLHNSRALMDNLRWVHVRVWYGDANSQQLGAFMMP